MLQEKLKILAQMKKTLEHLKISEKTDLEGYQKTFTSLLQSLERLRNQVQKLIKNHKQKEVTIKEVSIEQLEEEINDLNNRETELNELLKTEGHTFFHQKFPTSCFPTGDEHASDSEMKKSFLHLKHYHESMSGEVLKTKQSGRELATAERKTVEVSSEFHSMSSCSSVLKHTIISPFGSGKNGHGKSTGDVRDKIDECSKHQSEPTLSGRNNMSGPPLESSHTSQHINAQVLTSRRDVKEKIQNKKKTLVKVTVMEAQVKGTAEKEVKEHEEIFKVLLQIIDGLRSEVISMIKGYEKTEVRNFAEVRNQLEKEIKELDRKDTELEVISQTDDDISILQNVQSMCKHSESESTPIISENEHFISETSRQVNKYLSETICSELVKTSEMVIEVVSSDIINNTDEMFFDEISNKLKKRGVIIQKAQLDNESGNLVLLFCRVGSRIGNNITMALKKVSNNKKIILVVMHQTTNLDHVVADSGQYVGKKNVVSTVDYLFHETISLPNCLFNKETLQKVVNIISRFK
ncbi:DNA ligase 1-like [Erpetoichthys calabaricus]|uniref:DNA ligase 1-like n=1 Tax=Erpetoichthys calabaricus TaxID=27687 RepID=UPI002234DAE2|nr:DNA ligase 1-like [Erpetoichthys calabaricus]